MAQQQSDRREPIIGKFDPDTKNDILETPPHEGFDRAWADALDQANQYWRSDGDDPIQVTVELEARIDFWNPGGIGQYRVKISETP